ncbi:hypothetical protein SISSUDRAFT_1040557 [Sistotremastrum suecicum HHB10207 ss-3]|uniref:Zn(2)-C6 fungal-type domain-containing protein n=1 Tax=Sistotremastrum suecicum HHB10207 ss-3 TaxID=1314776 RepID=A0A166HVG8_9AGAM|nr:hypothetical protein SISSUDRAFT_1040557 [Sistotremastrum suecicum HHB10207 ss-3]
MEQTTTRLGKGINCAECRRSKLKCDRKIPCTSCVKRGCANICPDGMQAATKGMKLIAALEENERLKNRVKALEAALVDIDPRLVGDKLQSIQNEIRRNNGESAASSPGQDKSESASPPSPYPEPYAWIDSHQPDYQPTKEEADVVDAFGMLVIGDEGGSIFHGEMASVEYLLQSKSRMELPEPRSARVATFLPEEILHLSDCFPSGPHLRPSSAIRELIFSYIPDSPATWRLYEQCKGGTSSLYEPVPRHEFIEQIYSHIFPTDLGVPDLQTVHPHRVSVLFMICALGTLFDQNNPAPLHKAEEWHQLARACVCLYDMLEEPSIPAIQTLYMMCLYTYLVDRSASERRWTLMGVTTKMAYSIGLHRDAQRWNLDPAEVQRRRNIFWELCSYDVWMSFVFGRPPSFSPQHIDCKFPDDPDGSVDANGKNQHSFHAWKFRFSAGCLATVSDVFGAPRTTYAQVLHVDRLIRKCYVPVKLRMPGIGGVPPDPQWAEDRVLALQRFAVFTKRETNLLLIHRAHFAQALDDKGTGDLLQSRYAASVLAAYRSGCLLISGLRDLAAKHPKVVSRTWFFWAGPYSAAVVLGSLIIRATRCRLARAAVMPLNNLVALFQELQPMFAPENALSTLQSLQASANKAMDRYLSNDPPPIEPLDVVFPDLDGRTRLISKTRSKESSPVSPGSSPPAAPAAETSEFMSAFNGLEPSIVEYFKKLDGSGPSPTGSTIMDTEFPPPASVFNPPGGFFDNSPWTPVPKSLPLGNGQDTFVDLTQPQAELRPFFPNDTYFYPHYAAAQAISQVPPPDLPVGLNGVQDLTWNSFLEELGIARMDQGA